MSFFLGGAFSGLIEIFLFSFLLSFENHLTPNYNYPQLNMYQQPYGWIFPNNSVAIDMEMLVFKCFQPVVLAFDPDIIVFFMT